MARKIKELGILSHQDLMKLVLKAITENCDPTSRWTSLDDIKSNLHDKVLFGEGLKDKILAIVLGSLMYMNRIKTGNPKPCAFGGIEWFYAPVTKSK